MSTHRSFWTRWLLWCGLACLGLWVQSASAASYVFGATVGGSTFPTGCTGSAGIYTCSSPFTLNSADTVTFNVQPSTVTFSGTVTANGAQINAAGSASNLTLTFVSGAGLTANSGAQVNGRVNVTGTGAVSNTLGTATFGGAISTTSGGITLAAGSSAGGAITSTSGSIILYGTNAVAGNISCSCTVLVYPGGNITGTLSATLMDSSAGASIFGGTVSTTSGYAIIGPGSTVYGDVTSSGGNADIRANATINGNVSSGSVVYVYGGVKITGTTSGVYVNNDAGTATFGGSITSTTGFVSVGPSSKVTGNVTSAGAFIVLYDNASVTGNINATSGYDDIRPGVTINGKVNASSTVYIYGGVTITGDITGVTVNNDSGTSTLGGNVTATTGFLSIGHDTKVAGSLSADTGHIYLYDRSTIGGGISCDCDITVYSNITVGGGITVNSFDNGLGNYSLFKGSVRALTGNVTLGNYGVINGDAVSETNDVVLYGNSSVGKCARAKTNADWLGIWWDHVTLYTNATSGGICCGTGSTCSTACTTNLSLRATPPACATLPSPIAEYLFNQGSWTGATGEVLDTSGNGWNASAASLSSTKPTTTTNTPALTGTPGTCNYPTLNRSNKDHVALPQGFPHLGQGGDFMVTVWIRSTDVSLSGQRIFADDETGYAGKSVGLALSLGDPGTGKLRFITRASSTQSLDTTVALSSNTWYFVAFGVDALNKKKYIYVYNTAGTLVTSTNATYALPCCLSDLGGDGGAVSAGGETNSASGGENTSSYGFSGNIDELRVYPNLLSTTDLATVRAKTNPCASSLDHVEIRNTSGWQGLTCAASQTFTVVACANAQCSSLYTGGVSGSLTANGATVGSFNIVVNDGSASATVNTKMTTAGAVTMAASGIATTCNGTSGSCVFTLSDSGLLLSLDSPYHVAETSRVLTVQAVQKNPTTNTCGAAFQGDRNITLSCGYVNPVLGSKTVSLTNNKSPSSAASLVCGNSSAYGAGQALTLNFDTTGTATATLVYPDVGRVTLNGAYAGSNANNDTGLSMNGQVDFIAAPASFTVAQTTSGPIKAGNAFNATITAKTSAGNVAPNFGQESASAGGVSYATAPETATMTWSRFSPTGTGSSAGSFTAGTMGGFSAGVATVTGMSWSEVGTGTLASVLTSGNYLGTGLTASGATNPGGVGPFVPHHYNVAVSNGCGSQFTYSGQPFGVTVTARNANDTITANHDGTGTLSSVTAVDVSLSAVSNGGTGILSNATVAAAKFVNGTANVAASGSSPTFTFNTKPFVPTTVTLRAADANAVSSSGYTEGGVSLRSGRIKVSNKFGASGASLTVPVQTQYWAAVSSNVATWVVNDKDSCTVLPTTAVVMGGYYSSTGASTAAWPVTASAFNLKSPGNFELVLTKSNASVTGSVDFAFALDSTATDQSCLNPARSTSGATTGAGLRWLRAQYGSTYGCAGNSAYDRDPSARATFGVYSPENRKAVHVRDIF